MPGSNHTYERRCLLTVHAHPDDEASKGAGTVAKYHEEGVYTVLVCCTGGEEGEVLNPAMDRPEVHENMAEVRRRELAKSAQVIGYDEVVMLGYRDSGMLGSPANEHPDSFAQAPLDEAVGRLVELIRRHKPQVIVTYPDEQKEYPHPDHVRVHEISVAAFDAAGDLGMYPGVGDPFEPLKLYHTVWSVNWMRAMYEKFLELGIEPPGDRFKQLMERKQSITTSVPITGFTHVRGEALLAHATQVDPTSAWWFGLPPEVQRDLYPFDEYFLASSRVGSPEGIEDDLFACVNEYVAR